MQQSRFRKRLFKNKATLLGMLFIVLTCIVAIFAYPLSPDDSTDANHIILELQTKSPGFSIQTIQKYNQKKITSTNWLKYLINGKENNYTEIPITTYTIKNDSILYTHYLDESTTELESFALRDILLPNTNIRNFEKKQIHRKTFYLGTDKYGRDILSRMLLGTRISLLVGIIAVLISISVGVFLGALAGYYGGRTDVFVQWLINIVWAIPTILIIIAITFALGKGFWQIFISVGLTMWVGTARLIRGQVLSIKELDYIKAARTMGFSSMRIIVRHILPNIVGPVMVLAASNFATAILIEAGLSFLGVGIQPPTASWGLMIKENYNFIITNKISLAFIPGIAIMLLVLSFNMIGNGLRDAFDVKGKI